MRYMSFDTLHRHGAPGGRRTGTKLSVDSPLGCCIPGVLEFGVAKISDKLTICINNKLINPINPRGNQSISTKFKERAVKHPALVDELQLTVETMA